MRRPDWAALTDTSTVRRRAGGRRRYNAERRQRMEERRRAIAEAIGYRLLSAALTRGLPAQLAPVFGVSESTVWRDLQTILWPPRRENFRRDGALLFTVIRDYAGGRILRIEDADGREIRGRRRRQVIKSVPRYVGRRS